MSWFIDLRQLWERLFAPADWLQGKYLTFKKVLDHDRSSHRAVAKIESFYHDGKVVDFNAVRKTYGELSQALCLMIEELDHLAPGTYRQLLEVFLSTDTAIHSIAAVRRPETAEPHVLALDAITPASACLAGAKAANLACIGNELKLPVPRGFVITTNALQYFLESNGLAPEIADRLTGLNIESSASLAETSAALTALIETAPLPAKLTRAIAEAAAQLGEYCLDATGFCVRSSAEQEDSALSFAGQYRSLLNVKPADLAQAYKKVIASKYSASALAYRVANGLLDEDSLMAVLVLEMVDAKASGILYTDNPLTSDAGRVTIYAVRGLGEVLVRGVEVPDVIELARVEGLPVLTKHEAGKLSGANLATQEAFATTSTPAEAGSALCLDEESARQLAEWGLKIEAHFGTPQDMEWCQDQRGKLYVLQSRQLLTGVPEQSPGEVPLARISNRTLLAEGDRVAPGVAVGRVVKVVSTSQLTELPEDTVLVASFAPPEFTRAICKLRAVVTDGGSIAGHFASVAREQGIPTLANTRVATQVLQSGETVTVDADRQMVFSGTVEELLRPVGRLPGALAASPFRQRLRSMLDWISPLNLPDPRDPAFSVTSCKTLHDMLRFAHEKAVQEMLALGGRKISHLRGAKRLASDIPLTLYVLDLGNGLVQHALRHSTIKLAEVVNPSLNALWRGLEHPSLAWPSRLRHLDWQEFDRVSAGVMRLDSQLLASFALISQDYLNINIRFGYHFVVLDSLCGEEPQLNYITMRFEGGGASFGGRYLRVLFVSEVLQHHAFEVFLEGERLEAQLRHVTSATLREKMQVVGRLLGFTRLLDIKLTDEAEVARLAAEFIGDTSEPANSL